MEALLVSTGVVALAEIGDKTQLLALLLAARFKSPVAIIAGITCATILNHALAGALGMWITATVGADMLRWLLGLSFLAVALWTLVPDTLDTQETTALGRLGVFGATLIAFFLAEMGDKTQIATVTLTAHYAAPLLAVAGTTLGMLLADVPAVLLGHKFAARMPVKLIRLIAAGLFATLGLMTLLQVDRLFG